MSVEDLPVAVPMAPNSDTTDSPSATPAPAPIPSASAPLPEVPSTDASTASSRRLPSSAIRIALMSAPSSARDGPRAAPPVRRRGSSAAMSSSAGQWACSFLATYSSRLMPVLPFVSARADRSEMRTPVSVGAAAGFGAAEADADADAETAGPNADAAAPDDAGDAAVAATADIDRRGTCGDRAPAGFPGAADVALAVSPAAAGAEAVPVAAAASESRSSGSLGATQFCASGSSTCRRNARRRCDTAASALAALTSAMPARIGSSRALKVAGKHSRARRLRKCGTAAETSRTKRSDGESLTPSADTTVLAASPGLSPGIAMSAGSGSGSPSAFTPANSASAAVAI